MPRLMRAHTRMKWARTKSYVATAEAGNWKHGAPSSTSTHTGKYYLRVSPGGIAFLNFTIAPGEIGRNPFRDREDFTRFGMAGSGKTGRTEVRGMMPRRNGIQGPESMILENSRMLRNNSFQF
jgi:hypothetical protein